MRLTPAALLLAVCGVAAAACLPPPTGLDAWWAGENNAGDALGGASGVVAGNVEFADGRVGRAFRFNGDGAYVDLGSTPRADGGSRAFSLAFWVRPDSIADVSNAYIIGRSQPDAGLGWDLRQEGAALRVVGVDGWGFNLDASDVLVAGQWHHVVLVVDADSGGEDVQLFVDGTTRGTSGRSAISNSPNPLRLGFTTQFGGAAFAGVLDEVQLFNRALTNDETSALAAAGGGLCAFCAALPDDRFGWWPGEDDALDASGEADGVAGGSLAFVDGVVGRAFDFDGGSFVELPASTDWNLGTDSFTVTAWFRTTASDAFRNLVRHHDGGPSGGLWGLRVIPGGQLQLLISSFAEGQLVLNSEATVTDDRWHSVAAVRDAVAGELRLYLDGRPAAAPVADIGRDVTGEPDYRLLIGAGGWAGGGIFEPFIGQIDEVAFHRRALAEDEILTLATADGVGVCLDCTEAAGSPAAWWSFEGGGDERLQGLVGNLRNDPGFVPGRVGQALAVDFDTLQSSLEVPHHPSLAFAPQQPMAITLWAKRNSDHAAQHLFSKRLDCFSEPWNYQLAWESGPDRLCFGSAAGYVCTTADQLPRDAWTHLGLSFDGSEGTIYVNGEAKARAAMQLGPDTGQPPLRIGDVADCDWLGQGFRGLIDEFAIHPRALSRDEVYREYAAGGEGRCALDLPDAIFASGFEAVDSGKRQGCD
jgi:hypothetical protein